MAGQLGNFDPLQAGWHVSCHRHERTLIRLADMRQLARLDGATAPAAFVIDFDCPLCESEHRTLLGQHALDWQPVMGLSEPVYDLMAGRAVWDPDLLSGAWMRSMQRGRWPLHFDCSCCGQVVPGWPSQLRRISPEQGSFLVAWSCPSCEQLGIESWSEHQLQIMPATP